MTQATITAVLTVALAIVFILLLAKPKGPKPPASKKEEFDVLLDYLPMDPDMDGKI